MYSFYFIECIAFVRVSYVRLTNNVKAYVCCARYVPPEKTKPFYAFKQSLYPDIKNRPF